MLWGTRGVQIHPQQLTVDLAYSGKLPQVGVPASVETTGRAISVNAVLVIVTLFSTLLVAVLGVPSILTAVVACVAGGPASFARRVVGSVP
jgi:hypothetical protein